MKKPSILKVRKIPDVIDLAQNALQWSVHSNATPVPQAVQLSLDRLLPGRFDVLAGVDHLEHRRDLAHVGRGHLAENIAVPMHDGVVE